MADDYVVRFGGETFTDRSLYMTKKEATKFYDKLELNTSTTWKELLYEPLEEPEKQVIVRSDSVKVMDLGFCKIAVPERG